MSQIICRDVSLGYDGISVCENLNFTVNAGDYLCVVGNNGSGKSTLIKCLLGIRAPLSGNIIRSDGLRVGDIGYLPQQSEVQHDFPATVREVVSAGCAGSLGKHFFYSHAQKERVEQCLRTMNVAELSERAYSELSGGQMQRVLLARALCAAKKIILLDEPVSGLDPETTAEMYDVINHLNSHGLSVIMVTHDISAAAKYASCVLHMGESPEFFPSAEEYKKSRFFGEEASS